MKNLKYTNIWAILTIIGLALLSALVQFLPDSMEIEPKIIEVPAELKL